MRRSLLINSKTGGGGGDGDGENNGRKLLMTSGESIVAQRNAAAVKSGRCIVSREPIMNFLMVPQGRPVKTKFISPSSNRTSNSDELFKKKVIGLRKPQAHQFIKSTGVPRGGPFLPVLQDLTNLGVDVAEDDEALEAFPAADAGPEEKTWQPLVLWSGEIEKEDGETFTHSIQVADSLCKVLRPHQREGVQFVFECVTGQREFDGNGCILADDMGLGKTLQSIVVLHTLLKNGFKPGERVCRKAIVVTPTSLVKNWANEIKKWVGDDMDMGVVAVTDSGKMVKVEINKFLSNARNRILIISYETFRGHIKSFPSGCRGCCDLLICDEAHRLKNSETITNQTLATLECRRRILLSGTPLQNDLSEFYAMVDFTNPGILGTPKEFNKNTVRHILTGREPDATDGEIKKAQECQAEMSNLVNEFILRRTNTLNAQHLPPKLVQVVCCKLTEVQQRIYKHLLSSKEIRHICEGKQTNILSSIGALQKLCNHPHLLQESAPSSGSSTRGPSGKSKAAIGLNDIAKLLPPGDTMRGRGIQIVRAEFSGKMMVLERLMQQMRTAGSERIVIVSNYTQTLDMIGNLCQNRGWPAVRLDGSTNVTKRQKIVDVFNDPNSVSFAFLLSSKAGGCGINLIGANRLVLFDPDWNPAVDKQAAARVWREGQKRRCFIYRFVSTGTIEEKIFMRQLSKEGLQSIVDDKEEVNSLSSKDLRQLFRFDEGTVSDTHKKLACTRCPIEALKSKPQSNDNEGFNRAQTQAVCGLVTQLQSYEIMQTITEDIKALVEYLNAEQKADILDLVEVQRRLNAKEYKSVHAFTKHMRQQLTATDKAAATVANQKLQQDLYRFSRLFEEALGSMAPLLLQLRDQVDEDDDDGDKIADYAEAPAEPAATEGGAEEERKEESSISEEGGSGGDSEEGKFQPQLGMPLEEDMNNWSHHWSVDTVDDPIMRTAMLGASDVISFVFGLEVTWDLLQKYPQPEAKPKERKKGAKRTLAGGGSDDDEDDSDEEEEAEAKPKSKTGAKKKSSVKKSPSGANDSDDEDEDEAPVKRGRGRPAKKAAAAAAGAGGASKAKAASPAETKVIEIESGSESEASGGSSSEEEEEVGSNATDTESEDEGPKRRKKQQPQQQEGQEPAEMKGKKDDEGEDDDDDDDDDDEGPRRRKPAAKESKVEAEEEDIEVIAIDGSDDDDDDNDDDEQPRRKRSTTTTAAAAASSNSNKKTDFTQTQTESEGEGGGDQDVMLEDPDEEDGGDAAAAAGMDPTPLSQVNPSNVLHIGTTRKRTATNRFAPSPPKEKKKKSPVPGAAEQKNQNGNESGWICGSCTFANPKGRKKCELCLSSATKKTKQVITASYESDEDSL